MINNIKVYDKSDYNLVEIEINKDLRGYNKMQILQLSRKLAMKYNDVYSYTINSELLSILDM